MVAYASHSPSSTRLVIPKHSTMRLGRVLDVATRFLGARLRCIHFVLLNYSWVKEVSITDDGESLNHAFSVPDGSHGYNSTEQRSGYWMSIIHAKMK